MGKIDSPCIGAYSLLFAEFFYPIYVVILSSPLVAKLARSIQKFHRTTMRLKFNYTEKSKRIATRVRRNATYIPSRMTIDDLSIVR